MTTKNKILPLKSVHEDKTKLGTKKLNNLSPYNTEEVLMPPKAWIIIELSSRGTRSSDSTPPEKADEEPTLAIYETCTLQFLPIKSEVDMQSPPDQALQTSTHKMISILWTCLQRAAKGSAIDLAWSKTPRWQTIVLFDNISSRKFQQDDRDKPSWRPLLLVYNILQLCNWPTKRSE